MTEYTKKDAQQETDSSRRETSAAWHAARDDAAEEGGWGVPADRHNEKEKDSSESSSKGTSGK